MVIKPFEEKYLDDVYEIEKACFSHPWTREDLKKQLDIDTSRFLVAVENEKAVGYMGLQIFSGEGYVTNIAVLPEYRQRGIATALIEKQLESPMDFITLEVRESNIPAIKLYTKMGFKNMGIRPKFYSNPTENAIIMTRKLIKSEDIE